jgi:5-methyltetrahydrofolate--homocysteine methyltransferase
MSAFLDRLMRGEVLVGDGATGTMLMARGLKAGECPEAMNLDHPEVVEEAARLYVEAGADLVETNTFGGSPLKLAQYSLEAKTEEINRAAVQAARRATGDSAYVAASCGPSGALLKPYGEAEPEEVFESFKRQLTALVAAGVDVIFVETMTDLAEARLAIGAAREISGTLPIAATMTFDVTPRGIFTIMGNSVAEASAGLAEAGADIIGSNCGLGIENMILVAEEYRRHTDLPLLIQANAGLPRVEGGTLIYPESAEFTAEKAGRLIELGVNIIGGCCGTTPEHVAAMRRLVDESERGRTAD